MLYIIPVGITRHDVSVFHLISSLGFSPFLFLVRSDMWTDITYPSNLPPESNPTAHPPIPPLSSSRDVSQSHPHNSLHRLISRIVPQPVGSKHRRALVLIHRLL